MKTFLLSLFVLFVFCNCENMTGVPDFSNKPALLVYHTYNYDNFPSFSLGLASTDKPGGEIFLSDQGSCSFMEWFNDGLRILYPGDYSVENDSASLKIYDIMENSIDKIWESKIYYAWEASISPDNHSIALALGKLSDASPYPRVLATINSDGTGLKVILDQSISDPQYVTDNQIFFRSEGILYSISPSGANLTRISSDTTSRVLNYAIDRQHRQLVYSTHDSTHKIYKSNIDGSETRPVFGFTPDSLTQVSDIRDPEFSPDGKKIVFARWPNFITILKLSDLQYVNYDIKHESVIFNPSWTADGNYIIYALAENQMLQVDKLCLDDLKEEKLVEFENYSEPIFELSPMYWLF